MRGEPPDLAEIVLEGGPIDPEVGQLLLEDLGRDAVEEQVHAKDDDDEIVEHAEHGHAIGDDVERKGEVHERPAEEGLARGRHAVVVDQRPDEPDVDRRPAGGRQQRAAIASIRFRLAPGIRRFRRAMWLAFLLEARRPHTAHPGSRVGTAQSTSRSPGCRRPDPAGLTIEHPFGTVTATWRPE